MEFNLFEKLKECRELDKDDRHSVLVNSGMVRRLPEAKKKHGFDVDDINKASIVFTDALNISCGSCGSFQLYKLMQAYLSSTDAQEHINTVVKDILNKQITK